MRKTLLIAGGLGSVGGSLVLSLTGRLTLDLRWGRTLHQVGPVRVRVDAPRDLVYEAIR